MDAEQCCTRESNVQSQCPHHMKWCMAFFGFNVMGNRAINKTPISGLNNSGQLCEFGIHLTFTAVSEFDSILSRLLDCR